MIISPLPEDALDRTLQELRRCGATRDLGRLRIASKALHEAMMGTALNLWDMGEALTHAQLTALGRATVMRKYKQQVSQAPAFPSAASNALASLGLGSSIVPRRSAGDAAPSHTLLQEVGFARSWRCTGVALSDLVSPAALR